MTAGKSYMHYCWRRYICPMCTRIIIVTYTVYVVDLLSGVETFMAMALSVWLWHLPLSTLCVAIGWCNFTGVCKQARSAWSYDC